MTLTAQNGEDSHSRFARAIVERTMTGVLAFVIKGVMIAMFGRYHDLHSLKAHGTPVKWEGKFCKKGQTFKPLIASLQMITW